MRWTRFFLKSGENEGRAEKAYWGGVAVFPKNHFDLAGPIPEGQDGN
jgi:hypothetical protein